MPRPVPMHVRELLRSAGLRVTAPRAAVLHVLLDAARPLTQEKITHALGKRAPNKVTIYRILDVLIASDIAHKAFLQDRTWHFEPAHRCTEHQCHPHFSCTRCGRTDCLTEMNMPLAPGLAGYVIRHQRVQLEGLCPECSRAC